MEQTNAKKPGFFRGLSARLLVLTIVFVLFGEILIYVPSIARFRLVYLEERLAAGELASLSVRAAPDGRVPEGLESEMLEQAGILGVAFRYPDASMLMIGSEMPDRIDDTFDLRGATPFVLIMDAFEALSSFDNRMLRVLGPSQRHPDAVIDIALPEAPMRAAMFDYSRRILNLSIVLSLITATLVYLSLQWLMVRPTRQITENLVAFRRNPEDVANVLDHSTRSDEIGVLEREIAAMQRDIRRSLVQKTRLAALGESMSRINHDLRNSLASAMVVSDRLAQSEDPEVQKVTPRLMAAIDRAVNLCSQTLEYARSREPSLKLRRFDLRDLVEQVWEFIGAPAEPAIVLANRVPEGFEIYADQNQMFRVILNLARNGVDAMAEGGALRFEAARSDGWIRIEVSDEGPGLPESVRQHLFEPFAASGHQGGTGLGLAIARELMRAHGGDVELVASSEQGTRFRLTLPDR